VSLSTTPPVASPVVGLVSKEGKFIPVCALKAYGGE